MKEEKGYFYKNLEDPTKVYFHKFEVFENYAGVDQRYGDATIISYDKNGDIVSLRDAWLCDRKGRRI